MSNFNFEVFFVVDSFCHGPFIITKARFVFSNRNVITNPKTIKMNFFNVRIFLPRVFSDLFF